jgi:tripartite-type tricarboxylate transporter receptor subunit TctC
MKAANYLANIAPRDGSELLEIVQALPLVQAFGQANINFDLATFSWVGNMTDSPVVYLTWRGSPVHDLESAKREEAIFGSTTTGALFSMMPLVMNRFVGTKFKVINGYDSGKDIELATERGEIAGFGGSTWSSLAISQPEWLSQKKVNILAQAGLRKAAELGDVPLLMDLGTTEEDRAVLRFYSGVVAFARAFAVGPDVPKERVTAWREAFDATMANPAFIAEAAAMKLDINPIGGEALQKIIVQTVRADKDLLVRAQSALVNGSTSRNAAQ